MEKENKTRLVCMNCLHSVMSKKHDVDPPDARLIIMWSCDKCCAEGNDIEFFNYNMVQVNNKEEQN